MGFMVSLPNGDLLNIFRLDTGFTGNHSGNTGKIVKRYSYNGGTNWTVPETIFDSHYDDRNMGGGITEDGRIVCFFNRYNASNSTFIDLNLIYSDDNGITWSYGTMPISEAKVPGTMNIFGNDAMGYYTANYFHNYIELLHSNDGISWDSIVYAWDYRLSQHYKMTEPSFEYLGNGVIIGLWRNESGILGESYLQVESYDFGRTWSDPRLTNIADGYFCPSPWIFYDGTHNDLWVIATDRRANLDTSLHHNDEEVWIYKVSPDEILGDPSGYNLHAKFLRPSPSFYRLFGYPNSVRKENGDYLIMFTENYYRHNTKGECAYLYQFEILYSIVSDVEDVVSEDNSMMIYPNPVVHDFKVSGNFGVNKSQVVKLTLYNSLGQIVMTSQTQQRFDNSFLFSLSSDELPSGIYICMVECGNSRYEKRLIKPNN